MYWLFRKLISILVISVIIWGAGFVYYLISIPLQVHDDSTKTDAIVVLTGGSDRVTTGIGLYVRGMAPDLFISGVGKGVTVDELLLSIGYPLNKIDKSRISLGREAGDTVGNARETAIWVRRQNVKSVRVVTASYHMPRSLVEFNQAMPEINIIPHPVFPENIKISEWWKYKGTTELLVNEYHKYILSNLYSFTRYI